MKRKFITACVVAAALIVGLIVSALGSGQINRSGPAGARHRAFSKADPQSLAAGAAAWTEDAKSGSGNAATPGSKPGKGRPGEPGDDGELPNLPDIPPGPGTTIDVPELPVDLPKEAEVLCSTEEREAIEATADGMREDVLDEAEAAKATLLNQLGLGSLLGGVPPSVHERLDAIDASAQDELDEVEALVADAIAVCEAGGDPLSAF